MFSRKKNLGDRLKDLFGMGVQHEAFYDALEDLLIEADIGASESLALVAVVRAAAREQKIRAQEDLEALVLASLSSRLKEINLFPDAAALRCYLFLGVNGVGKTTSIAKYASFLKGKGYSRGIVLAAGDTFRAAAVEQLTLHGERLGLRTVSQGHGADPAAVIYDAIESAKARGDGLVLADTAGRLHNKAHLVKELEKIDKIVRQKLPEPGSYRKILVIDSTTGQNGLQQAEVFHEAVGIDAVFLSKYDSTARGGIVVSICGKIGLPIAYFGTGEKYEDISVFSAKDFASNILAARG